MQQVREGAARGDGGAAAGSCKGRDSRGQPRRARAGRRGAAPSRGGGGGGGAGERAWPRLRKWPLEVRTSLGLLFPVSLSTTSLFSMCGLARPIRWSHSSSARGRRGAAGEGRGAGMGGGGGGTSARRAVPPGAVGRRDAAAPGRRRRWRGPRPPPARRACPALCTRSVAPALRCAGGTCPWARRRRSLARAAPAQAQPHTPLPARSRGARACEEAVQSECARLPAQRLDPDAALVEHLVLLERLASPANQVPVAHHAARLHVQQRRRQRQREQRQAARRGGHAARHRFLFSVRLPPRPPRPFLPAAVLLLV